MQVRLVEEGEGGENGEDALVLERLGCGSRLSNISAIMEMFGEQVHNPLSSHTSSSSSIAFDGRAVRGRQFVKANPQLLRGRAG